ncbi:unnamed protein product [Mycena citricolor]|uniref:BTB domain-containing protein n=1 Tax=Mycena citricolor TaxID=2018698 RepID=A0AAD2HYD5_9AGAR|nr:unnamed protein product [Mycena citricolor]
MSATLVSIFVAGFMKEQVARGEPWMEDGNVCLVTADSDKPTAFKVHRSVMARHSEIFESMFMVPQPPSEVVETAEGCQVVRMWDPPQELASLIEAIYDGLKFANRKPADFFHLAGILRLSTKYEIAKFRQQAITFLSQTWSHTLQGHDNLVDAAIRSPVLDGLTYPWIHPLHVLNLAQETDVRIVVPSAVYFLSLYQLEGLLRGDHPKLKLEHPSKPSSELSPTVLVQYTLMHQKRLDIILHFVRDFCNTRNPWPTCGTMSICTRGFTRLASRLGRSWIPRTGPIHYMSQAISEITEEPKSSLCEPCRQSFIADVKRLRDKTWNELPAVLNLPSWEELEAVELHAG